MSATADPERAGAASDRRRASIRDYLTDGSLAALCDELAALTGARVELRDESGEPIRMAASRDLVPPCVPGERSVETPLLVEGARIGSLALVGDELDEHVFQHARAILALVGRAASELCADVAELRGRVKELGVLHRLSALLASGGDPDQMLEAAFESAVEVLELDAGSLVLLPEDADGVPRTDNESELTLKASLGLSDQWLRDPSPLSRGRAFDRHALAGEVVVSEDLLADPRVLEPGRCVREGIRSFIGVGLVFKGRPIGVLRLYSRRVRTFAEHEKRLLRSIGQQGAAAVEQARLMASRARERRVQRQLRLAGQVQARMLPRHLPSVAPFDVAARCEPSSELGGDFYDVFPAGDRLAVVIGDVVGKGIAAALLMSAVRATLRAYADRVDDLASLVAMTNEAMCRDSLPNEFATLWVGLLDPGRSMVTYCSAGHDPPLLVRAGEEIRVEEMQASGLVLGVEPEEIYEARSVRLGAGDVIFAYTDGITDARSFDADAEERGRFGRERLRQSIVETLAQEPDASAGRLLDQTMWHVRAFAGLAERADDETAVVIRVGSPAAGKGSAG